MEKKKEVKPADVVREKSEESAARRAFDPPLFFLVLDELAMRAVAGDPHAHALPSHPTGVLQGHEGAVLCVAFNASGAYALTGGMVKRALILINAEEKEKKKLDLFFFSFVFPHQLHHHHHTHPHKPTKPTAGPHHPPLEPCAKPPRQVLHGRPRRGLGGRRRPLPRRLGRLCPPGLGGRLGRQGRRLVGRGDGRRHQEVARARRELRRQDGLRALRRLLGGCWRQLLFLSFLSVRRVRLRGREGLLLGRGERRGDGIVGVHPRRCLFFFFFFFFFVVVVFVLGTRDCPGDQARGRWHAARCRDGRAREGVSAETELTEREREKGESPFCSLSQRTRRPF